MWAIIRDISERKRAEEVLRNSERRFRSLFGNSLDAVFLTREDGPIDAANPAACAMFGMTEEEICRAGRSGLVVDDERLRAALEKRRLAGRVQAELTYRRKNGTTFEGDMSSAFLGENERTFVIVRDITERKRALEALRLSEEKFATLFRCSPMAITVSDLGDNDRILEVNEGFENYTGHSRETVIGRTHPPDWLWADRAEYAEALTRFARDGRLHDYEFRFRRKSGETRDGILYAELILVNNKPCMLAAIIDITDRKRAQAALRESEARLVNAERLARVGSWELDLRTQRVRWSDEMFRIYGVPKDGEIEFPTFLSYVHPKDRSKIADARARAASSDVPVEASFRVIRPDGDVRVIRSIVEVVKNETGLPVVVRGAAQDITEEVSAVEQLRESEKRLTNAERIAHVGNWRWDMGSKRVFWSEELFRILGISQNCAPAFETFLGSVVAQERGPVSEWVNRCMTGEASRPLEFHIVRPGGELRDVMCTIEIERDETGLPAHVSGTCQDVTEAKQAQAESVARQTLESLGTMARGIAHDFNNLLGGIHAQAELAAADLPAGSSAHEELGAIREIAMRGSDIVRQLMIYAGKESGVPEPVDISKTVEEMLVLLKSTVSKRASLVTDLREGLPVVSAPAAQIRQIVMNLVVNASEAIANPPGVVRVATRRVSLGPDVAGLVSEEGLAEGDYVQLEVADTGSGMSPETLARIFDPFFSTKSAGRGLGLSLVQGIVRTLRGAIRVSSESGKGTVIQVLLPITGALPRPAPDSVPPAGPAFRGSLSATVLLVEDEDPLRDAVAKMLAKAGVTVVPAADGSEAIELVRARASEIDLLLLDMTIPGRSSSEVLAEALRARPEMRVVLTSAYSEETVTATLNTQQVHGFVRKPFELDTLLSKLRHALSP